MTTRRKKRSIRKRRGGRNNNNNNNVEPNAHNEQFNYNNNNNDVEPVMTNTNEDWIAKADELINQGDISNRYIDEYPFGDLNLEDNRAVEEGQPKYNQWRISRDNLMREVINGFYRQAGKAIAIHKYKRHGVLLGVMDEVYEKLGADWKALVQRERERRDDGRYEIPHAAPAAGGKRSNRARRQTKRRHTKKR